MHDDDTAFSALESTQVPTSPAQLVVVQYVLFNF